jgi:Putative general bacterial porin
MKSLKIVSAIGLALIASHAGADDYISEIGLSYFDDESVSAVGIQGALYFDTVQTNGLPLTEAAFLNKASNVNLTYARLKSDFLGSDQNNNLTRLGIDYFVPNSIFYLGAGYSNVHFDSEFGSGSADIWDITVGITPLEGLLVSTTHQDGDVDDGGYDLNLMVKYVTQLSGDTAVNFEVEFQEGGDSEDGFESEDYVSLAADYYLNHTFSLGAIIEDSYETGYGVRTRKFFTPSFSAMASYLTADEYDMFELGVAVRF